MSKKIIRLLPLLLLVFAGMAWGLWQFLPRDQLKVVFCDVGQGDGIYLRMPSGADMVVDGGPNDKIVDCVGKYMPPFDRKIELVIMTHPQKDHMQGFINLFRRYEIDRLLTVPVGHTTEGFRSLKQVIEEKHIPIGYPTAGNKIKLNQVEINFFWPHKEWLIDTLDLTPTQAAEVLFSPHVKPHLGVMSEEDLNLFSLYALVRYGSFELLLTGDADSKAQRFMSQSNLDRQIGDIEVLKFPHHGSGTGITKEFLKLLQPEVAVIMAGKNSYGHPHPDSLKLLQDQNVQVWRTDRDGDVILTVGPKGWDIKPTKN